jgi:hypothetical protein
MRERWFADNRDLIKWSVLVHLARTYALRTIVQVPYWRPEKAPFHFIFRNERLPVTDDVWRFFRDIHRIEQLGDDIGVKVKIVREEFNHANRWLYSEHISRHLKDCARPLLLFLDPDTGIQPKKLEVTHTTEREIERAWAELRPGDWLVFYQHARRESDWVSVVKKQLSTICKGGSVEVARSEEIGRDVAFLCVRKPQG